MPLLNWFVAPHSSLANKSEQHTARVLAGFVLGLAVLLPQDAGAAAWAQIPFIALCAVLIGLESYLKGLSEKDRLESSSLFHVVTEVMPVPVVIANVHGAILFANEKANDLLQQKLQTDQPITFFANGQTFRKLVQWVDQGKTVSDRTFQLLRGDGSTFFGAISAETGVFDGHQAIVFTFIDQTEKIASAESMRESESRFRSIFENSFLGIMTFDSEGRIESFNRSSELLFGCRSEDAVGRNIHDFLPGLSFRPDTHGLQLWSRQGAKGGSRIEIKGLRAEGREFPAEVGLSSFYMAGNPYIVALVQDISDRKQSERELLKSAKMASVGEVSAGIVHEINNPLTVINGMADRLLRLAGRGDLTVENARQCSEKIAKMSGRISAIIKSLKALAHMGDHQKPNEISLRELVAECVELTDNRCSSRGIDLSTELPDQEMKFFCRSSEICQVLVNLINNSADAIKDQATPWIKILAEDDGDAVTIKVIDSGDGIPEALQKNIMSAFFTTKEKGQGTGLGLSISKKILAAHGGHLKLDTNAEHTTFVVSLPKQLALDVPEKAA